jgi:non-specific serine/threonine protein kinase
MGIESSDSLFTKMSLFEKYAYCGDKEKALMMVTDEVIRLGEWDDIVSWMLAQFYSLLNENEQALNWLEIAVGRGWFNYPFLNEYDPFLENIRGEPRFKRLMERVKLEWENLD